MFSMGQLIAIPSMNSQTISVDQPLYPLKATQRSRIVTILNRHFDLRHST